jgi:hypothetical protein
MSHEVPTLGRRETREKRRGLRTRILCIEQGAKGLWAVEGPIIAKQRRLVEEVNQNTEQILFLYHHLSFSNERRKKKAGRKWGADCG